MLCSVGIRLTYHVCDIVDAADPQAILGADTGNSEYLRAIDGDASNADPLLQNLKPDNQLHAATCMELAGADAEEHAEVALLLGSFLLEISNADDILKLCLGVLIIISLCATEPLQDETSLIFSTDLD